MCPRSSLYDYVLFDHSRLLMPSITICCFRI
uniref:Uncharacterized protein n=1 Tax=Arundo donax TaxID=35708 RepID=A0A0A8YIZ5_ARUDO